METQKKNGRGGARPGSGRKKTTERYYFRLDLDLQERLEAVPEIKSRYINQAIREKLDRDGDHKIDRTTGAQNSPND